MSILKFLGLDPGRLASNPSAEIDAIRKIADSLDRMDPDRARFIASFAYILSRVARADLEISEQETRSMERIIVSEAHLPEEQAIIVVQMAKTQNILFGSTENFLVTREFGKLASKEQKIALLHCLFSVSAADQSISSAESDEIRQIADEIKIDRDEFIAIRSAFREHLQVLRRPQR